MKEICRGFHFTSYYTSFQTNRVHSKWVRLYIDLHDTLISSYAYLSATQIHTLTLNCPESETRINLIIKQIAFFAD